MSNFITITLDRDDMARRGRIGALRRWSRTPDRVAATEPARAALLSKFERQVDPDGTLDPAIRAELVEYARKEHFARLGRASALARQKKAPTPPKVDAQEGNRATTRPTSTD